MNRSSQATIPQGTVLLREEDMTEALESPFADGTAVVFSSRSPDKETNNEDAVALIPFAPVSGGLLVVADGVGGHRAGDRASGLTLELLAGAVTAALLEEWDLREAVLKGVEAANGAVATLGVGAGTTLAIAEIQDHTVRPYHVGDSSIMVTGQRGLVKLQTISHSPTGYAVEAGLLGEDEALHHEERHLVSNIVGTPDMRIEMGSVLNLAARDTLLLGSDGLFDNLTLDEIRDEIRKGPLLAAGNRLVDRCRERMATAGERWKPDDLSFVLYRQNPPRRRTPPAPGAPSP